MEVPLYLPVNPSPAEPGYTLCKQCRSGSALFVIQNVTLYQQSGSSNLTN